MKCARGLTSRNHAGLIRAAIISLLAIGAMVVVGLQFSVDGDDASRTLGEATPRPEVNAENDRLSPGSSQEVAVATQDAAAEVTSTMEPAAAATYSEAQLAFYDAHYDEAAALFAEFLDTNPDHVEARSMLGLSLLRGGNADGAETALEDALALDRNHVKSLVNLARVLITQSRAADALAYAKRATVVDRGNAEAHRVLGRAYHARGMAREAEEAYREAIAHDRHDAWAFNNLGLLLIERAAFEEALAPLARAAQLDPGEAVFQNNLGIALERTGRNRAAADAFARAVACDVSSPRAEASLARVVRLADAPGVAAVDLAVLAREFDRYSDRAVASHLADARTDRARVDTQLAAPVAAPLPLDGMQEENVEAR